MFLSAIMALVGRNLLEDIFGLVIFCHRRIKVYGEYFEAAVGRL